jgi:hypothetical protein
MGNLTVLLLLDTHHLDSYAGLDFHVGKPTLLSIFKDPSCFVGWGYPSVWGSLGGYTAAYQCWNKGNKGAIIGVLAESLDAVTWRISPGQGVQNVSNAVYDAKSHGEFSVVYDDSSPSSQELKMLTSSSTILRSTDNGQHWAPNGTWTSQGVGESPPKSPPPPNCS